MSIALDRNGGGNMIQRSRRLVHGMPGLSSIYDSSSSETNKEFGQDSRRLEQELDSCSSSSSSVGRNSDSSDDSASEGDDDDDSGEREEVECSFKGPLNTMDQLEEVLPVKRGMSMFYSGKSKSFTSLADVSSVSSVKDLAKPKNRYTKKRKNLLAQSSCQDMNALKNNGIVISKRSAANSSPGSFLLGETLSNSISLPSSCLPPLHPHSRRSPENESSPPSPRRNSPWRSFSLSDLSVAAGTANISGLGI